MSLNKKMLNKIEILAPSGDFNSLVAAINNGADAVYLGLDEFNARVKAENFTKDNIKSVVQYAHLFCVKVYVTVNILIKENEYPALIELLKATVNAKVDAYLVQDMGVARLIKECFPGAVLHASTQMGVNNLYSAKYLEDFGFTRVVLARETKEEEIRLIKENTSLEIEYFAHGALCVSYSGNCYLSSFNFLQSGNRGRCLQLCRLEYESNANKKGYLLSARDLCLIKDMDRLIEDGVTSFKIEGRLKREGYVGLVTKAYKDKLISLGKKNNYDEKNTITSLKEAFVRGDFSYQAYLNEGVVDSIIETENQNHTGVKIGKVISIKKFKDIYQITINTVHQICKGDGLKFFNEGKQVNSLGVGNFNEIGKNNYELFSKNYIPVGSDVHLILNKKKEDEVLHNQRLIDIDVYVKAKINYPLVISMYYKGKEVSLQSEFILQKAMKAPITENDLYNSINKFDKEPFKINNFECSLDDVFAPKSVINDLRRQVVEKLKDLIIETNEEENYAYIDEERINEFLSDKISNFNENKNIIIVDEKFDMSLISNIDNLSEYIIVLSPSSFNETVIKNNIDKLRQCKISSIGLNVPLIMGTEEYHIVDKILDSYPYLYLLGNNIAIMYYCKKGYKVILSQNLNIISSYSKKTYLDEGATSCILSLETSKDIVKENKDAYYYSLGYNTLMNYAHCPYKTVYENDCSHCHYNGNLTYSNEKNTYRIRRTKAIDCKFELINSKLINTLYQVPNPVTVDLRLLNQDEINRVINSLNEHMPIKIKTDEYTGLLNKDVK